MSGYGSITVKTGGATIQGTLVTQDNEQIAVRVKDAAGNEEERTILLTDLDPEPIEELTDLTGEGYFWIQVMLADTGATVSGDLVEETDEDITLQVGGETRRFRSRM